jgi:superfamily II DNA helicase RecQ
MQGMLHAQSQEIMSLIPHLQVHHLSHDSKKQACSNEDLDGKLCACPSSLPGDLSQDPFRMPVLQGHHTRLQLSQVQVDSIQFLSSVKDDSVIIMPTGSGKTTIIRSFGEKDGVVIVITPFQKLGIQLQDVLGEKAFRWPLVDCSEARCIAQAKYIVTAIEHCGYNSAFILVLKAINERRGISKIFVDEVHHLLEAGSPEFRPCLGTFWTFRNKLFTEDVHALVVGLTATLRKSDVPRLRELITGTQGKMPSFRKSCYRPSVRFQVGWTQTDSDAQDMCIVESLALAEENKLIVFATTINTVNLMAHRMDCQAVTSGVAIDFERFDRRGIIVASSCAGHGLDMKDIHAVYILGVPFNAETLIQWAGRIRKSGFVKLFLNKRLVFSLSRKPDRRGELARVLIESAEHDLQVACCRLLDEEGEGEHKKQNVEARTGNW